MSVSFTLLGAAVFGGCSGGSEDDPPISTTCGDGVVDDGEVCDGDDLAGATCASEAPSAPAGFLGCASDCGDFDLSRCQMPDPNDNDGDGVRNDSDPAPDDRRACGDSDSDGCDDCSVEGRSAPNNDGYDEDGDGTCELALDYDCMNGANAASDPYRLESCILFTHTNDDRALFSDESGGGAPVVWNEAIWEISKAHALDMCRRGFFSHVNPENQNSDDRAIAAGLGFTVSENISVNFAPGAAQYGWMEEPTCRGHRGNILHAGAIEVGIGYHDCDPSESPQNYQWRDHHHIVANFRTPGSRSQWCTQAANDCEIPPNPPSTADCTPMLESWGFCPDSSAMTLDGWNCPND